MTAVRSVKTSAPLQGGAENCPGLCSKLHFNPQSASPGSLWDDLWSSGGLWRCRHSFRVYYYTALVFRGCSAQEVIKQLHYFPLTCTWMVQCSIATLRLCKFTVIDKPIESKTIRSIYITLLMPQPLYFTQEPWYEQTEEKWPALLQKYLVRNKKYSETGWEARNLNPRHMKTSTWLLFYYKTFSHRILWTIVSENVSWNAEFLFQKAKASFSKKGGEMHHFLCKVQFHDPIFQIKKSNKPTKQTSGKQGQHLHMSHTQGQAGIFQRNVIWNKCVSTAGLLCWRK